MKFNKPAFTDDQQLDQLIQRGVVCGDRAEALHYLGHINYYRLAAYWLPFEADHASHSFKPGTRFVDVLNLYIFDRELRLLVLDAIERVEVSVRTGWAYTLAHRYGPHAHLNACQWPLILTHLWPIKLTHLSKINLRFSVSSDNSLLPA
ncbi:Abi family protein [Orrella marina]|uniref:Abi family protein n=1 Tax=Orrella marina TaxID=2163011 RepID=A0A2R4XPX2_9BURK|nr:Abi family protein [Orrella marina]AWB35850.1 hypothetical protein DBV39_15235 [Orrella marina]